MDYEEIFWDSKEPVTEDFPPLRGVTSDMNNMYQAYTHYDDDVIKMSVCKILCYM